MLTITDQLLLRTKDFTEKAGGKLKSRQVFALIEAIGEYLENGKGDCPVCGGDLDACINAALVEREKQ